METLYFWSLTKIVCLLDQIKYLDEEIDLGQVTSKRVEIEPKHVLPYPFQHCHRIINSSTTSLIGSYKSFSGCNEEGATATRGINQTLVGPDDRSSVVPHIVQNVMDNRRWCVILSLFSLLLPA